MKRKPLPPPEYLHECFEYREEGFLVWKKRPAHHFNRPNGRHDFEGYPVGCVGKKGHVFTALTYNGKSEKYYVHCIIWTMFNGVLPEDRDIDHDDGDKTNNRIGNLRLATGTQNNLNAQTPIDNTSGIKGISWHKRKQRWVAEFKIDGVKHIVGQFANIDEAEVALRAAREAACKEFTNHGVHKYDARAISKI